MPDFLPQGDRELALWMSNFAKHLPGVASECNIAPEQLAAYLEKQEEFAEYYRLASEPTTRTTPVISGKNAARRAIKTMTRQFVARIRGSLQPTDSRLIDLGLKLHRKRRNKVPFDLAAPMLGLKAIDARTIQVRAAESTPTTRRGMPPNAQRILLFQHIGEKPPAPPENWHYVGSFSRAIFHLTITGEHAPGTKIWLSARWLSRRAQASACSQPCSIRLTFDCPMLGARASRLKKNLLDKTGTKDLKLHAAA